MRNKETAEALEVLVWEVFQTFFRLRAVGKHMGMIAMDGEGYWSLLRSLATDGDKSIVALAKERALNEDTVRSLVDDLRTKGAVDILRVEGDDTVQIVRLTEQGKQFLQEMTGKMRRLSELLGHDLDLEELQTCHRVLHDLQQRIARIAP